MSKGRIAIIGAGNGGRAFAVYLANSGFRVNLGYRTFHNIREIYLTKRIISDGEIKGTFKMSMVTSDLSRLVYHVPLILVVTPASVHMEIARQIAPYLVDDQIILLNPGRTWGAIEFYSEIIRLRPGLKIYVGETQSLLFTCRKSKDFGVTIHKIKDNTEYCFYPEINNDVVGPIIEWIFPHLHQVQDIRITSLNNIGAVLHPAIVILNSGSISRSQDFLFYRQGVTPQIARIVKKVDGERCAVLQAMGLKPETFLQWVESSYGVKCEDFYQAFQTIESYQNIKAPNSLDIRYLTEDVPTGLVPLASLGKHFNIETPTINALIILAENILGINFKKMGRTIENVCLPREILERSFIYESSETTDEINST